MSQHVRPGPSVSFSIRHGTIWIHISWLHFLNSMLNGCSSKGLDAHQTAVHKYKSHHRPGLRSEIIALMKA